MEERAGQAGIPGGGGASPPAGPHGGLHGAEAWHWHRQEAYMDARRTCPWCAPCDDGRPARRRRRRLRDAEIDAMIARIDEARAMTRPGGEPGGAWFRPAWPWRAEDAASCMGSGLDAALG